VIQATRLDVLEGLVESALVSECLTPSQLAWTLEVDVRDVRRALDSLRSARRRCCKSIVPSTVNVTPTSNG